MLIENLPLVFYEFYGYLVIKAHERSLLPVVLQSGSVRGKQSENSTTWKPEIYLHPGSERDLIGLAGKTHIRADLPTSRTPLVSMIVQGQPERNPHWGKRRRASPRDST